MYETNDGWESRDRLFIPGRVFETNETRDSTHSALERERLHGSIPASATNAGGSHDDGAVIKDIDKAELYLHVRSYRFIREYCQTIDTPPQCTHELQPANFALDAFTPSCGVQ